MLDTVLGLAVHALVVHATAVPVAVAALVGAIGTTVQVARIGHAGAKASWSGVAG